MVVFFAMARHWIGKMNFKKASVADATKITNLVNSAYRGDSSRKGWTTEADLVGGQRTDPNSIKEIIERSASVILISETEPLEACVHLEKQGNACYLGMLTVDPKLQNKGIGAKMLDASEAFAKHWGCSQIKMKVISVREELIKWYERRGYRNTQLRSAFPANDPKFGIPIVENLEFIEMKKTL